MIILWNQVYSNGTETNDDTVLNTLLCQRNRFLLVWHTQMMI
jgi:hypothetical protein